MNQPRTLAFEQLLNGKYDTFPDYTNGIFFLEDFPDLLHIRCHHKENKFKVLTFRDDKECTVLSTDAFRDSMWTALRDGNTLCIAGMDSRTAICLTNEEGMLRIERVKAPKDLYSFILHNSQNYFVVGSWETEFSLIGPHSSQALLQWKEFDSVDQYFYFTNDKFFLCHTFEHCSKIAVHELVNGVYKAVSEIFVPFNAYDITRLGDRFLVLIGASDLYFVDCVGMGVVGRYAFNLFPGTVKWTATRITEDDSVEIFVSTVIIQEGESVRIFKASMPFPACKNSSERVGSSGHKSSANIGDLEQKYADLVIKNELAKKEIVECNQKIEELKSTVSTLQKSLEILEKKDNDGHL